MPAVQMRMLEGECIDFSVDIFHISFICFIFHFLLFMQMGHNSHINRFVFVLHYVYAEELFLSTRLWESVVFFCFFSWYQDVLSRSVGTACVSLSFTTLPPLPGDFICILLCMAFCICGAHLKNPIPYRSIENERLQNQRSVS